MAENPTPLSPPPKPAERPLLVHFTIAVVAVSFLAMVMVLYYQWLTKPEPNAMLVVEASSEYANSELELLNAELAPQTGKLTEANHYSCRFFLSGGQGSNTYSLKITRPDGRSELRPLQKVEPYQRLQLLLGVKPTTNPSAPTP